jgi:hypothetical protein
MGLDVVSRLFDIELCQRRIVRTGTRDQYVVDRRAQLVEESSEPFKVGRVESRGALRADFDRGALQALNIPTSEDQLGSLSACSSGRFEPDSGATADHNDGLPEEFRFALDGRVGSCGAHDTSNQQLKLIIAHLNVSISPMSPSEAQVSSANDGASR